MVLNRQQQGEIEYYFLHAADVAAELELCRGEIADAGRPMDLSGIRSDRPGDPTGGAVIVIEAVTHDPEAWLCVVHDTYVHFTSTPEGGFMDMYYAKGGRIGAVCRELHISRRTFYAWRADVLQYAALKATEYGVFRA